jgi:hypothetical protein
VKGVEVLTFPVSFYRRNSSKPSDRRAVTFQQHISDAL